MLVSVNLPDGDSYACYYTDDENDFASFVEDYTLEGMSNDYDVRMFHQQNAKKIIALQICY